jgi:hypothetical protein
VNTRQHRSGKIITLPKRIDLETKHNNQNLVITEIILCREDIQHIKIHLLKPCPGSMPICTITLQKNKLLQYRDPRHLMQRISSKSYGSFGTYDTYGTYHIHGTYAAYDSHGTYHAYGTYYIYIYITFDTANFDEDYGVDILRVARNYVGTRVVSKHDGASIVRMACFV